MTVITQSDLNRARRRGHGETITLNRHGDVSILADVHPAPFPLSLPLGADEVYREDQAENSVQIRVYEDKITLQVDRHNPKYSPGKHALADAGEYTALAALGVVALWGGA